MSNQLESFAQELKAKREEKNITIRDIYEKTRIDAKYLENIEKGDFDFMPDVYMRAFIRKYAEAVDFSADEAIKMYDAARKGKSVEEVAKTESGKDVTDSKSTYGDEPNTTDNYSDLNEKDNNTTIIIGLVLGAILIGVAYYFFVHKGNNEIIVEPRIEEILNERNVENETPKFEIKKNNKVIQKEIVKSDSLLLKINAIDTAWFRVVIDSRIDDEFTLNPNRTKVLTAQSKIKLLLGNAGGVEFFLNGKKLQFSGKKGEIRNISIDADGIHYLNSSDKTK
jgi:transcriptional regulator with XRE-family HTH domain